MHHLCFGFASAVHDCSPQSESLKILSFRAHNLRYHCSNLPCGRIKLVNQPLHRIIADIARTSSSSSKDQNQKEQVPRNKIAGSVPILHTATNCSSSTTCAHLTSAPLTNTWKVVPFSTLAKTYHAAIKRHSQPALALSRCMIACLSLGLGQAFVQVWGIAAVGLNGTTVLQ